MIVYISSAVLAAIAGIFATAKIGAADGNSLGLLSELDAMRLLRWAGHVCLGDEPRSLEQ